MIKKRRLLVMLYIFTCICIITTSVLAAFNFDKMMLSIVAYSGDGNAKFVTTKNEDSPIVAKKGVEVIIGLSIFEIEDTENGISSVDGYFNYNTNVFEKLNPEKDIKVENGKYIYNEEKNKLAIDYTTPIKDTIRITITLKTRADVSLGTYTNAVRFDNVELATVDSGIETFSISKNVQIVSTYDNRNDILYVDENFNEIENYPTNNNTNETNTISNETNEIINEVNEVSNNVTVKNEVNQITNNINNTNKVNNNTIKDDTIAKDPLPNTGIEKIAIPTLLALIIVSIIFYNKYNKLKEI